MATKRAQTLGSIAQAILEKDLYSSLKSRLIEARRKRDEEGVKGIILETYRLIANEIGLPVELRKGATAMMSNVEEILDTVERLAAQRKLAELAGRESFEVGMMVLCHDIHNRWVEVRVEKIHPDGKFTVHTDPQEKARIVDPRKTTVRMRWGSWL